jgi:hypothetical protein
MANIVDLIKAPRGFGSLTEFQELESWSNWLIILKAVFGLPLHHSEWSIYKKFTEREELPGRCSECYVIAGRRAGKSFMTSIILVYLAVFVPWELKSGTGHILCIATDRAQAQVIFRYIKSILELPIFKGIVEKALTEQIHFKNGVIIGVHSCNYRALRGYKILAAVLDELAFFRVEGFSPAEEILRSLRPALGEIANSLLMCISTPYSRVGPLWEAYQKHYGKESPGTLVVKAATLALNPTYSKEHIDREIEEDPISAQTEYFADWRTDIVGLFSPEVLEPCIAEGRHELPKVQGVKYKGFIDPSGGRGDAMTLSIGHDEDGIIVQDCIRIFNAPFNPSDAVEEFAKTLKAYGIREAWGDKYSGEWCSSAFKEVGIEYKNIEQTRTELYRELIPKVMTQKIEILDNSQQTIELRQLERRTGRGGREVIDHPPKAHDDLVNALAGLAFLVEHKRVNAGIYFSDKPAYGPGSHEDSSFGQLVFEETKKIIGQE